MKIVLATISALALLGCSQTSTREERYIASIKEKCKTLPPLSIRCGYAADQNGKIIIPDDFK